MWMVVKLNGPLERDKYFGPFDTEIQAVSFAATQNVKKDPISDFPWFTPKRLIDPQEVDSDE